MSEDYIEVHTVSTYTNCYKDCWYWVYETEDGYFFYIGDESHWANRWYPPVDSNVDFEDIEDAIERAEDAIEQYLEGNAPHHEHYPPSWV